VGAVPSGEGVYGMRRALVLAGAESQVVSLWNVSDSSTRELMRAFYFARWPDMAPIRTPSAWRDPRVVS
jgi:CHAT domain-containing protein